MPFENDSTQRGMVIKGGNMDSLKIKGISHITLICSDLERSANLFCELFDAVEVYSSDERHFSISKEKFFLIGDLWIALMEGESLERSYNHIAFHIEEKDISIFETQIKALGLEIVPSRPRHPLEGKSIYFYDYDNHLFELHTGDLSTRLNYYRNELNLMTSAESIKKEILAEVASILPVDPLEKEHLDFVKAWIASGAEIYRIAKPDNPNIHLVSYFIVIDPYTNEILLVDHKKAGLWLPSGGHVELNEHPRDTVKREVQEELGMEADFLFENPLFLTVTKTVGNVKQHTDVSLWYILKGNRNQALQFDTDEFHQIKWFQPDKIPYERTDPHMRRFVDKQRITLDKSLL